MISRIIKLAAIAVIAVLCIIALYTFWKKIRNMTKSQAKAEFKKLRLIRVDAFVFAVIICVAYTLVTYFDTTKQANAVVGLNYAEASLGPRLLYHPALSESRLHIYQNSSRGTNCRPAAKAFRNRTSASFSRRSSKPQIPLIYDSCPWNMNFPD